MSGGIRGGKTSQVVLDEASAGDPDAAARRLEVLDGIPLVRRQQGTDELANELARELFLPVRAYADAVHISLAVVNGLDFLLTWNCTHIANAEFRPIIELTCHSLGYSVPVICTPEELLRSLP